MYALRLAEDGRILEIMDIRYKTDATPVVEDYPQEIKDGACAYHYRYADRKWIRDPIKNVTETTDDILNALLGVTE